MKHKSIKLIHHPLLWNEHLPSKRVNVILDLRFKRRKFKNSLNKSSESKEGHGVGNE